MSAPMLCHGEESEKDNFRDRFKYFKRKVPPPDYSEVIDFHSKSILSNDKVEYFPLKPSFHKVAGVKNVTDWNAYTIKDVPGFVFITNPFISGAERYWVERCLKYYTNKPYVSNLDAHDMTAHGLWEKSKSEKKNASMDKLRWMTLGYHHDWDTKHYRRDFHDAMPEDLVLLCEHIASAVGFTDYQAQAAIINYYHMDSTLSGHTDHSEFDLLSPLISVSLGQSAIFLVGGETKSIRPNAMFLRSGDIAIMMKESRLAYHAVPRIVSDQHALCESYLSDASDISASNACSESCSQKDKHSKINEEITDRLNSIDWKEYADYMKTCRLNMNVRQVLCPGQSFPDDEQIHTSKKQKVS